MKNILVLCTGNSCRSQIAHGFLEALLPSEYKVFSAGIVAHGVNPKAIETMNEIGIDISKNTSNKVEEYANIDFIYIITVCDNAKENCPYFPSSAKRFHKDFFDPTPVKGNDEEIKEAFRKTRKEIEQYLLDFCKENIES